MKLVEESISIEDLRRMAEEKFGNMVKAVVDVTKKVMVVDADMHADEEKFLLDSGSRQQDLWGINLYPDMTDDDFVEFDSMINLRPTQENMSRGVDDESVQKKIIDVVNKLVR